MDTRESKTPEEEREHFKEVSQPEDYEHPEPDEDQPEARQSPQRLTWVLPAIIVVVAVVIIGLLVIGLGD
ncbi:hypothetical protein ACFPTY_00695 [Halomonas beimenensis]|uniref:Uncharacterized protein n=1 Tax=Halomonas beimenensis TaxID=475662 RepID=A0A291P3L9_9GAMM|nr:hypothetical protein [Halomonas beimenensis]ATJ81469.1 hypothetical protein BEI_0482 [Halomonas beimenensis]